MASRRNFMRVAGMGAAGLALGSTFGQFGIAQAGFTNPTLGSIAAAATPNAQMQAVLDEFAAFNAPPIETTTPEVARQEPTFADAVKNVLSKQGKLMIEQVGKIEHRIIQGLGGPFLVRIYTPQGSGPFPVLVYFHGGGFVIANLDTYDASCRALTNAAQCIVVSVAYRQAPEHKFPAAVDDAFTSYKWTVENAATFNGDPNKIALAGESAGGNLATVTAILARDAKLKMPVYQLLVYPLVDFVNNYASYQEFVAAKPLSTPQLAWFGGHYLNSEADKKDFRASPILTNLAGLPPAWIVTAEIDPLRDQGEAYKDRLIAAGVQVGGARYTGVTHEFFGAGAAVDTAKQAVSDASFALRRAFGTA